MSKFPLLLANNKLKTSCSLTNQNEPNTSSSTPLRLEPLMLSSKTTLISQRRICDMINVNHSYFILVYGKTLLPQLALPLGVLAFVQLLESSCSSHHELPPAVLEFLFCFFALI